MKKLLLSFSLAFVLGLFAFQTGFAQTCVELGSPVEQLSEIVKSTAPVCGPAAVQIEVCDCPAGFVAVGYSGTEGNQWGAMVLSTFMLRCRALNSDGTLGATVEVTCTNGSVDGNTIDGPIDAGTDEVLVGFEVRIGCAVDAVTGESKPLSEIIAGDANSNSNTMTGIGGPGGSAQPVMYVPDGNVIVGMQTYEDPNTNLSGGVAWRYAPLEECAVGCSISSISTSNLSPCDDGGTDDIATDDTFTADVTVEFSNPPATGTLDLSIAGSASVAVGSLVGNSHTFTGVVMSANGSPINLRAEFSDAGCQLTQIAGTAPGNCSPNAPTGIPTMSEWGLILFALIMFTLAVVFGTQRQRAMAIANGGSASAGFQSKLPFAKEVYFKMLPLVYLAFTLVFAIFILFFGYALTSADIPGSLAAGAIVAYLLHFVRLTSTTEK